MITRKVMSKIVCLSGQSVSYRWYYISSYDKVVLTNNYVLCEGVVSLSHVLFAQVLHYIPIY